MNTVKCLNLEKAAETKSGNSRVRSMGQDKQEGQLCQAELQTGKDLTGIAEIKELVNVWQPLFLMTDMAEPDGCFPQEHLFLEL